MLSSSSTAVSRQQSAIMIRVRDRWVSRDMVSNRSCGASHNSRYVMCQGLDNPGAYNWALQSYPLCSVDNHQGLNHQSSTSITDQLHRSSPGPAKYRPSLDGQVYAVSATPVQCCCCRSTVAVTAHCAVISRSTALPMLLHTSLLTICSVCCCLHCWYALCSCPNLALAVTVCCCDMLHCMYQTNNCTIE